MPELAAEKDAGLGMTQVARQVLKRLDTVVSENAEPLKSTIANINSFSAALARNSDKVDGIVAGLERFTGAGKARTRVFDLAPATPGPPPPKCPTTRLLVLEPTALALIDAERVRITGAASDEADLAQVRWPDILSKVLQVRIVQSFENAGYPGAVPRTMEDVQTDHRLMTNVRSFEVGMDGEAVARVEIAAKILDLDGGVVGARIFRGSQRRAGQTVEAAMETLDAASRGVLGELVVWGCDVLAAREKQSP